ncbi:response regulator receiver protein [Rubidibacter lacunae KORDI 51-2]|uniref:Response regulator receiver protein n=2 Tax=Rubidibacter TaxID=582491 RepID=U5D8M9_9CHRO|nr:response regulator receiver protein [Rubidibacter lacunae KORDI 51-2]
MLQGTLDEIDIRSILQFLELGQRTGVLFVEAPTSGSECLSLRFWSVELAQGRIVFATELHSDPLLRLRDSLRRYKGAASALDAGYSLSDCARPLEHTYLWQLLEHRLLSPAQGRFVLENLVVETLFDLMSLQQGRFWFQSGPALEPQLVALAPSEVAPLAVLQLQQWKLLHPHVQSPEQRPTVVDRCSLQSALSERAFRSLARACNGNLSLRRIARLLNRDLLSTAKAIYPYVECGWVQLSRVDGTPSATPPKEPHKPQVICIDSDVTNCQRVEYSLNQYDCNTVAVNDMRRVLDLTFELRPDFIFCALSLPMLAGDEYCAMLRATANYRHAPIAIILPIDSNYFDCMRAQLAGATELLFQPFDESEPAALLAKHLRRGDLSARLRASKSAGLGGY